MKKKNTGNNYYYYMTDIEQPIDFLDLQHVIYQ